MLVCVGVGIVSLLSGDGDQDSVAGRNQPSQSATLLLELPENVRKEARVTIDGKRKNLPSTGQVSYRLSPGSHRILLQRRGYKQIELEVALKAG